VPVWRLYRISESLAVARRSAKQNPSRKIFTQSSRRRYEDLSRDLNRDFQGDDEFDV
jgi:hypothetical protein